MRTRLLGTGVAAAALLLAPCIPVDAGELVLARNAYKAPPLMPVRPGRALRELERVLFRPQRRPCLGALALGRAAAAPRVRHSRGSVRRDSRVQCPECRLAVRHRRRLQLDQDQWQHDCRFVAANRNNWLSTVRGRVGLPFDRFLPYVTGGVAFGDITASNSNAGFGTAGTNKTGWTARGGLRIRADRRRERQGRIPPCQSRHVRLRPRLRPGRVGQRELEREHPAGRHQFQVQRGGTHYELLKSVAVMARSPGGW